MAAAGLLIPALLFLTTPKADFAAKEGVSVGMALVLIALYIAALVFTRVRHAHLFHVPERDEVATWSMPLALVAVAAFFVVT